MQPRYNFDFQKKDKQHSIIFPSSSSSSSSSSRTKYSLPYTTSHCLIDIHVLRRDCTLERTFSLIQFTDKEQLFDYCKMESTVMCRKVGSIGDNVLSSNGDEHGVRLYMKRRRPIASEDVDPQYRMFMDNLREDGNSYAFKAVGEIGVTQLIRYHREDGISRQIMMRRLVPDEDVDPQYKLFMENLREDCGGSYALEVAGENGISEVIRYHREDGISRRVMMRRPVPDEDLDPQYKLFIESLREDNDLGERECHSDHKLLVENCVKTLSSVEDQSDDDKDENSGENQSDDVKSVEFCGDDVSDIFMDNGNNEREYTGDENWNQKSSDDDVHGKSSEDGAGDPKTNLREDGNSCAQEAVQESGSTPKVIKYEQLNELPDVPMLATTENVKNSTVKIKFEGIDDTLETLEDPRKRISSVVMTSPENCLDPAASAVIDGVSCKKPFLEVPHNPVELNADTRETERNSQVKEETEIENNTAQKIVEYFLQTRSSSVKGQAQLEIKNPVSSRTRGKVSERSHLERESLASELDESYQYLLKFAAINDDNMTYVPPNGTPVTYDFDIKEENTKTSSGPDLIAPQRDPLDECHTPIMEERAIKVESPTNFREGLMEDLRRPYDQDEYFKLLGQWSRQRPGTAHAKNFRSGVIKTYALKGEYGKPYMEVYEDLAGIITASDRPAKLNLLRGFFYWLKNLTQEGSFQPWSDKEFLDTCAAANVV